MLGLDCIGYRDWGQLQLRDQTPTVLRRDEFYGINLEVGKRILPNTVVHSLEDLALGNFYLLFVRPYDIGSNHKGYFNALPRLFARTSKQSPLYAATLAFALATFRIDAGGRHCVHEARAAYVHALRRLSAVSVNDTEAATDETLLAVLLLQLVEVSKLCVIDASPEGVP